MFPHYSSLHEIYTETNAFVQNSMGDEVVLGVRSLYWEGEWERSDSIDCWYCDIKSINSNKMAVSTDHPKATAANDILTVLPSQTSELSSTGIGKACQSVAPVTTKNPTNFFLTYDNNKVNNAKHNHHKYRKQNTLGLLGQLGSSANNSKSTFKTLSDNKYSFRNVSVRVLSINVYLQVSRGEVYRTIGVPSLVRIPKSDCPKWLLCLPNFDNSYSILGFRLELGDNNKIKAHFSLISNNNSKSVILLSSIRNSDHCFLLGGGPVEIDAIITQQFGIIKDVAKRWKLLGHKYVLVIINSHETSRLLIRRYCKTSNDNCNVVRLTLALDKLWNLLLKSHFGGIDFLIISVPIIIILIISEQNLAIFTASSSITLIVSENEVTDHISRSFLENLKQLRVQSFTSPLSNVTVTELMQLICVPILKHYKGNNNNNINNNNNNNNNDNEYYKKNISISSIEEEINSNNNNPDVIEDIVEIAVCYQTSYINTNNVRILAFENDGISRTEATIFTVGALLFQDNNKYKKPLNTSYKVSDYSRSVGSDLQSNFIIKSVSKSMLNDKLRIKCEMSLTARLNESDKRKQVRLAANIPIMTTCEPTMTLTSQSATITSQTIGVPVCRADNNHRVCDDGMRAEFLNTFQNDQKICIQRMLLASRTDDKLTNDLRLTLNKSTKQTYIEKLRSLSMDDYDNEGPMDSYYNHLKKASSNRSLPNSYYDNDNDYDYNYDFNVCDFDIRKFYSKSIDLQWSSLISYIRYLICAYHKAYKMDGTKSEDLLGQLKYLLNIYFDKSMRQFNKIYEPILNYKQRWGISTILKLAGGGESSLNSGGATNWGSTQTTAPNNNNTNQSGWVGTPGNAPGNAGTPSSWGGNSVNRSVSGNPNQNQNQGPPGTQNASGNVNKVNNPNQQSNQQSGPPTSQSNSSQGNQNSSQWSQGKSNNPGGPGQNPQNNNNSVVQQQSGSSTGGNNPSNNNAQGSVSSGNTSASNNPSTKQQLEQLTTMREALFSQDGWGCQHVNQDTSWDVPSSPEPNPAKDGVPIWKPAVNNGTDLWEANLRNGGQPPPHQQSKTPWGHTPATNIGGTWGEDDETTDTSNMWTGAPAPSQPNAAQWTAGNQAGTNWADPRIDHRDPRDLRSVDPREMRDPRDHRIPHDPRDHMRVMDPMARDPRMGDMRGDPRGISGRLNGSNTDAMWGQPPGPPHHQMSHQHPSGPPTKMLNPTNMNQWAAPPPKDMMPGKPSGWEEPSPPTQRRNVTNYDDGTSLWGNPAANQRTMPATKVSHWKDLPTPNIGRGGMQCPPGMPQNRMPGQPGMKPDVGGPGMWAHPGAPGGRNGTWADGPHDTTSWDDPKTPATWNEPPLNPATWGGPATHKQKSMGPTGSWVDSDIDPTPSWGHPAKPTLTKDFIWNSREFRYLCDLGYKKEDVELALRNREMNRDEAQELLSQIRPLDQWPRRHDTHSGYDPTNQPTTAPAYPRFNHVSQPMTFPPGAGVPSAAASGGVGGSVSSASLLKLQQQQQQQTVPLQQQQQNNNAPQPPFNQASRAPQNTPSNQQLRMLVQQIQLAAQEGYLNHQILNQALSPQTLMLLNQLLQQIKILQQLHQQHSVQSSLKSNSPSVLQISVQITKTKQQIANLQNQIAIQQATFIKQQQQQQHQQHAVNNAPPSQSLEYYKTSVHDPMSVLQNSFSDLTMNKEPPVSQQQSRLNQWKLPSIDKDGDIGANEFSRAPGTTSKQSTAPGGLTQSHSSPNMNPLLGQGDGTWSSRLGDSGWPDPGNSDSSDAKDWQPGGAAFTDLVPEFEPGKPWRGTQMKSIEDDPSITPGSVVRSPLSLAAIKDPDAIFSSSSKTSPPPQNPNPDTSIPSLSNSTWTFNPPASTPTAFTNSKNTWESAPPPTAVTSELWGAPMSKARGPPPGLGSKGAGSTSNGWAAGGLGGVSKSSSSWGGLQSNPVSNSSWVSTWLLLRNLTPQIDGSTLKTLCMQHGPVQDFRLYLNHGIALTKYSSRDEAIKAQGALNNCVLGNTTIFAESPADSEVHTLLQQLSHGGGQQQAGGSGAASWGLRPTNKAGPPPDTWGGSSSQLWGAPPTTNSLWSNTGIDTSDQQRATPSSLNSYLPGDLLGGESM
ncbi:PREDICTED: trinucleotide repeat-containing gene 6C protein isoform X2 [Polistes dominula]|uniref:Trinucleotide repeat-containing gene 6C protein isoform X2 n=1 Tax=Polistes dominula TaxID=743375 RepID=A0ABM1I9Y5_POLDO|nr:PREDICTED: trinucleotide repeat-containing gene 6C protein isoform X2 [Polistes dominula]